MSSHTCQFRVSAARRSCFLLLALLVPPSCVGVAHAGGGPVGSEYGINDRELPPKAWWTSCTDTSGRRATLVHHCTGDDCDEEPGDLFLQRYSAGGQKLGAEVQVNVDPAWLIGFRVSCSDDGWVAAQWLESGCNKFRVFDPSNQPAGDAHEAYPDDCRTRPNIAVEDDGSTMAAWPASLPGAGSQILVRRFAADGAPIGDVVQVSDGIAGSWVQPKVSIDESGVALVAWLGRTEYYQGHGPVLARFVAANGQPAGESFQVNTFGFGANSDPAIARLGGGDFEVAWNNPLEGGRLAREVHASGVDPSALPAAPVAADLPRFGAPRIVDSYRASNGTPVFLTPGAGSTWIASDSLSRHWRTGDDSKTWTAASSANEEPFQREALGTNGAGVWMALGFGDDSPTIHVSRSTDDGTSWSSLAATLDSPKPAPFSAIRVRGTGSTWVAAWTTSGNTSGASSVNISRSSDGGVTWSKPKSINTGDDVGALGFELATDDGGTWLAMLVDTNVRFLRSQDDGASWSSGPAEVENVGCTQCAGSWRYTRVGLAGDGAGNWVALYAAARQQTGLYGRDGDVFALRSDDDGISWSAPTPVAPWSANDGSPDFAPSVATDGKGKWLASWISHQPVDSGDDLDSDVVLAVSKDAGATWSAPTLLTSSMDGDHASDTNAALARRGAYWMLAWERAAFAVDEEPVADDLVVAVANATCGNGKIEVGESCDDGNVVDDDGCDSNCIATGCGNGIATSGEICDDGNKTDTDECTTLCERPRCGDGVLADWEECDDGNTIDDDACPNHCGAPRCGDFITQRATEDCDSGGKSTAECTPDCHFAKCGDGYIATGVEACDDGNSIDDDTCANDCLTVVCGDGYTAIGFEECDPEDHLYANACTDDCRLVGLCGDANADASVTTADARFILRKSVGLGRRCPPDACDMDANGKITVLDAHMDLRKAVGLEVGDQCSIGTGNIVFWIQETRSLGSFQFDVDYSQTGGDFAGSGGNVECTPVLTDTETYLYAFNDAEEKRTLTAGMITKADFAGQVDLFSCRFEMPEDRADARFLIHVVDATNPDGETLDPLPLVGYRVE